MRCILFLSLFFLIPQHLYAGSSLKSNQAYAVVKETVSDARALFSMIMGTEFHRSYYGGTYADERTQALVKEIKQRMGFADSYTVHVLYLNAQGIKQFGIHNLIATSNCIFIDQAYFDSLSYDEQYFLLAHELAHIYYQDVRRMTAVIIAASVGMGYQMYHYLKDQSSLAAYAGYIGGMAFILPAYGRYLEQRADGHGAKTIGNVEGGIACCKRWMDHEPRMSNSSRIMQFYYDMFATHPSNERRIEALEALHIS